MAVPPRPDGFTMTDILTLPQQMRSVMNFGVRQGEFSLEEVGERLKLNPEELQPLLDELVTAGYLLVSEGDDGAGVMYQPHFGRRSPL